MSDETAPKRRCTLTCDCNPDQCDTCPNRTLPKGYTFEYPEACADSQPLLTAIPYKLIFDQLAKTHQDNQ